MLGFNPAREPLSVKRRVGYLPDTGRLLRQAHRRRQSALHRAADRLSPRRAREAHRRGARAGRPCRGRRQARRHLLARHAAAARARRNPDEGRADRDPRRADVGPRSARHHRTSRHHPRLQGRRRVGAAVVASARAGAERVRPRGAVQRRPHRADGHGARARPRRCSAAAMWSISRRTAPGLPSGSRSFRASAASRRPASASFACMPIATCGRKRRPRSSRCTAASNILGVQEPSLEAIYTRYFEAKPDEADEGRSAPCSVKARPFPGSAWSCSRSCPTT